MWEFISTLFNFFTKKKLFKVRRVWIQKIERNNNSSIDIFDLYFDSTVDLYIESIHFIYNDVYERYFISMECDYYNDKTGKYEYIKGPVENYHLQTGAHSKDRLNLQTFAKKKVKIIFKTSSGIFYLSIPQKIWQNFCNGQNCHFEIQNKLPYNKFKLTLHSSPVASNLR